MRAALFDRPGLPLSVSTLDDPRPNANDLILRVKSCGVCGSDLHMTQAHTPHPLPGGSIMGHEFAGEVVEIGSGLVGRFREGQRIVGFPYMRCGQCEYCLSGDHAFGACSAGIGIGAGQRDGAYAEYVRIDAATAHLLPDIISFDEGALVEPLAVGLHAVDAAGSIRGATVLIVGAGPVGLSVIVWANTLGARHIIVSEFTETRRQTAMQFGATDSIDPGQPLTPQVRAIAGGPPEFIFECVGAPGILGMLVEQAPRGARIIVAGVCMQPDSFMPVLAVMKELTLKFVLGYRPEDFDYVIGMIARDRIDVASMISDHVTLDSLPAAFEALRTPNTQNKVMIHP